MDKNHSLQLTKQLQIKSLGKDTGLYFSRKYELGKGAFGQVYLGFDQNKSIPFAVKVISLEKIMNQCNCEVLRKKIKDEIVNMVLIGNNDKNQNKQKNEQIVQFYQAKESGKHIYILCQYCNGTNLDGFLKNRGYLTEPEAISYFKQILRGFLHLRKNGVVHRDLKPANLLMHNYSLKIADLGFSKSIDDPDQLLQSIVGTPLYMAPQIFQRQKYTQKCDIWSLGVILFEMLYGRPPWIGCANLVELKQRIKKQIKFPQYPFVTQDTKELIRRTIVVQQKERLGWETLFHRYLEAQQMPVAVNMSEGRHYQLSSGCYKYFRDTFFIQNTMDLHKRLLESQILSQQVINSVFPVFKTNEQFFKDVYFKKSNEVGLRSYYKYFIEKRNQVSFLFVLISKMGQLMSKYVQTELKAYCYCIFMLAFKYSATLIQEITFNNNLNTPLFSPPIQAVAGRLCQDKLFIALFNKDKEIIAKQYEHFHKYFSDFMGKLGQEHPQLIQIIEHDLSGIYKSEKGQKRVIRFFLCNYLKKVYNILRILIKDPSKEEMVNQDEQNTHFHTFQSTLIRLIVQFLTNETLFDFQGQLNNKKQKTQKPQFRKNLTQILYDCETTTQENFFVQLQQSSGFQEESVMSFMSKEIKWNAILMPRLS